MRSNPHSLGTPGAILSRKMDRYSGCLPYWKWTNLCRSEMNTHARTRQNTTHTSMRKSMKDIGMMSIIEFSTSSAKGDRSSSSPSAPSSVLGAFESLGICLRMPDSWIMRHCSASGMSIASALLDAALLWLLRFRAMGSGTGTKHRSEEHLLKPRCGPWRAMSSQSSPVWTQARQRQLGRRVGELRWLTSERRPGCREKLSSAPPPRSLLEEDPLPPVCFSVCATVLGLESLYSTV